MKQINENRKGYKKTPVGWIPEEWEVKELKQLGDILSGGTPDTENPEYWNGTINWCTPTDITALNGNKYIGNTSVKITEKGLRNSSAKLIPENSIVVCTRATIGTCAITKAVITTNQGFKNIIPGLNVNTDYLYYMILFLKNQLLKLGNGSTFLEVSKHDFERVRISLPRNEEQTNISKILCCWDILIQKTQTLIELKEKRKKALMQQLLTGKKRLKGFTEELKVCELGAIFSERKETNYTDLPLLSITADKGVVYQTENEKKDTSNDDKSKYKRICIGDIGYNTMRMWQGRSALSSLEGIVSPAYTIIKIKNGMNAEYFSYLFKTPDVIHLFYRKSQGLVSDTLNCKYHNFAKIKLRIPKKKEQDAITEILKSVDKEINKLKATKVLLIQQKRGLMQALLTGKVRFKTK